MKERTEAIHKAFAEGVYKCVVAGPVDKENKYKKIEFDYLDGRYTVTKYTDTQVFHEQLAYKEAKQYIENIFSTEYKHLNSWDAGHEHSIRISKKGKFFYHANAIESQQAPKMKQAHNREKNYILQQGTDIAPLIDMGIFTKDGKVVNAMYDKYRQINRFIEIIDDEIKKIDKKELTVLDFGCGKSYLTFILYYYFTVLKKINVKMIGLDLKPDVIEKCNLAAGKYGYKNLEFHVGDINGYEYNGRIDMVITLHACDTATDFALYNAICRDADMIFSVPCCQHEINSQIKSDDHAILLRYGIIKERLSSLITDAIRCNLLECCGYKTQMVEFVAFEHTPKNIMIRASKKNTSNKKSRLDEVESLIKEFNLNPTLYKLLKSSNHI